VWGGVGVGVGVGVDVDVSVGVIERLFLKNIEDYRRLVFEDYRKFIPHILPNVARS